MRSGRVARLPGVDDGHPPQGPRQDQRGGLAGGASADHHDVVFVHATRVVVERIPGKWCCHFRERARSNRRCDDAEGRQVDPGGPEGGGSGSAVAEALDGVGPRLLGVREHRGSRLTQVAERPAVQEHVVADRGGAAPTELGVVAAPRAGLPGADRRLVGAPDVGDPRDPAQPRHLNGRTVLPLTGPGGVQAWKIIVPASQTTRDHGGTTASSGSTCCREGCGSASATRTWVWVWGGSRSSTPWCRTGSAGTRRRPC